jgi:hypothetical protein
VGAKVSQEYLFGDLVDLTEDAETEVCLNSVKSLMKHLTKLYEPEFVKSKEVSDIMIKTLEYTFEKSAP